MARLFISHSSANNAQAFALRDWLAADGFADVFLDVDPVRGLVAGERWQEALKAAADRCEAVLFLVSPAWLDSKWCLAEFLLAKTLHKRIFGLIVEEVPQDRVPVEMAAEWQLCNLVDGGSSLVLKVDSATTHAEVAFSEIGLELLRRGLQRAGLDGRSLLWPPAKEPDRAPYRGLRALEPEDAAIFFGRDAMIVRALDGLRGLVDGGVEKLLVVLGASGSGKSSFLRAGLLPRLARDDVTYLPLPVIRPEAAAITGGSGLVLSLAVAFSRVGAPLSPGRLKETLAEGPDAFLPLLNKLAALSKQRLVHQDEGYAGPTLVLSIDQAEELFNPDGAEEAAAFLKLIGAILMPPPLADPPRAIVVAAIRSDRYELLQADNRFSSAKRVLFDLPPIPISEFKSVIEGPAQRVVEAGGRLAVEPALTAQLIADAQGADALPLLSFTLERLYADYGGEGRLTLAEYERLGGVRGSIEAAVAKALAEPGRAPAIPADKEQQLASLRAAFIPWLARVAPDTGAPMRRVARVDEIPESSRAIAERLVGARLLVADRRAGVDVIEVAHESLLRQWPALAAWLEADADNLKVVDGIERAAREWGRNGRLDAWLDHRAERLIAAEGLIARGDFRKRLAEEGVAYLVACRAREQVEHQEKEEALAREQTRLAEVAAAQLRTARVQRISRWSLAGVGAAVLIGIGFGLWQRQTNFVLRSSLDIQQAALAKAQTNLFSELAITERLRGNFDAAMRFAVDAARLAHPFGQRADATTLADIELETTVLEAGWRMTLSSHAGSVAYAAFSPDSKEIVTASADGSVHVWNAQGGTEIVTLSGHEASLWSAIFSPDGTKIITASEDGNARIWNAATAKEIAVLSGHTDKVTSANFSPDGKLIVTSSFDGTARIWDAASARQVAVLEGHQNSVQSAMFSPDGSSIVTASDDGTVRIWDAATAREIVSMRGHESAVYSAAFSPDGKRVVSGSNDTTARIWNARTGEQVAILRGHDDYVNGVTFSPDGSQILTSSGDQTARLWDAVTFLQIKVLRGHQGAVQSAEFSPDGSNIVTASRDESARVWPAAPVNEVIVLRGHENWVMSATMSSDGARIVTASADKTAQVWDAESGRPLVALRGHEAGLWSAVFSPDNSKILTSSEDRTARLWDAVTGQQIAILSGHENWVMSAVFSPDGSRAATASWDGTARIFDLTTGKQISVLRGNIGIIDSVSFSPDGARLATASRDGTAHIWDIASGKELLVLRGHASSVFSIAFNRDGTLLVTAAADKTARIWDGSTGKQITILRGHDDAVWSAAFSPDGKRVVTASQDMTARIWDAASGREIAVLLGHDNWVMAAAFSPDGSRVLTSSRDRTARLWTVHPSDISNANMIKEACVRRLGQLSQMTRDDMQLAGFPDDVPQIDVCAGLE